MANYVKPVIFDNEELAEGVYATGSGADCWRVTKLTRTQNWEEGRHNKIYEIELKHKSIHKSYSCTVTGNISSFFLDTGYLITAEGGSDAVYECYVEAGTYTIKRISFADENGSEDTVTYKIYLWTDKGIAELEMPAPVDCQKGPNEVGEMDY